MNFSASKGKAKSGNFRKGLIMQQLTIFDFLKPDPEELLEIKDENMPRIVEYISKETGLNFEINKKRGEYIAQEKNTVYCINTKVGYFNTFDDDNGKPYIDTNRYSNIRWNKNKSYFSWTSGAFEGQLSVKDAVNFFLRERARVNQHTKSKRETGGKK